MLVCRYSTYRSCPCKSMSLLTVTTRMSCIGRYCGTCARPKPARQARTDISRPRIDDHQSITFPPLPKSEPDQTLAHNVLLLLLPAARTYHTSLASHHITHHNHNHHYGLPSFCSLLVYSFSPFPFYLLPSLDSQRVLPPTTVVWHSCLIS